MPPANRTFRLLPLIGPLFLSISGLARAARFSNGKNQLTRAKKTSGCLDSQATVTFLGLAEAGARTPVKFWPQIQPRRPKV